MLKPAKTLTDEEMIHQYVLDMQWRELSKTTVYMRETYLNKFSREVGFRTATKENVQAWLSRDSLKPQSRAIWLTSIHCFYAFANKRGFFDKVKDERGYDVDFDPTSDIAKPKAKKGRPHPIPNADLELALKWATPDMKCWLLIGALCGCRCCEIATIRREDVNDGALEPWLNIEFGKGGKQRAVPLHPDVIAALNDYGMRDAGPLWDINAQKMSRAINDHLHSLGIKSTAHALRHFFGTNIYRSCLDLQLTADLLGHSNTAITSVYAASDRRKAAGVVGSLSISG